MNVETNLLGHLVKTPSGSVGVVCAVIVGSSKIEVLSCETNGVLVLNELMRCRVVEPELLMTTRDAKQPAVGEWVEKLRVTDQRAREGAAFCWENACSVEAINMGDKFWSIHCDIAALLEGVVAAAAESETGELHEESGSTPAPGWAALAGYLRSVIDEARAAREMAATKGNQTAAQYWDGKVRALDSLWNVFAAELQAPPNAGDERHTPRPVTSIGGQP